MITHTITFENFILVLKGARKKKKKKFLWYAQVLHVRLVLRLKVIMSRDELSLTKPAGRC